MSWPLRLWTKFSPADVMCIPSFSFREVVSGPSKTTLPVGRAGPVVASMTLTDTPPLRVIDVLALTDTPPLTVIDVRSGGRRQRAGRPAAGRWRRQGERCQVGGNANGELRPWLLQIVANQARNQRRAGGRRGALALRAIAEERP